LSAVYDGVEADEEDLIEAVSKDLQRIVYGEGDDV
jgi:hypothetical protein